ncbi:MAG: hypothetical protein Kow0010_06520 [Dehalococcoidia bacterium]
MIAAGHGPGHHEGAAEGDHRQQEEPCHSRRPSHRTQATHLLRSLQATARYRWASGSRKQSQHRDRSGDKRHCAAKAHRAAYTRPHNTGDDAMSETEVRYEVGEHIATITLNRRK